MHAVSDKSARPMPGDLHGRLLAWYDAGARDLPWRTTPGRRPDPYRVWLSEVMLQQTTVAVVGAYYTAFLARFPQLPDLAAAPLDDVLHAWQGLGYYRRARALHACANELVARHDGVFPRERQALMDLPGIGPYTADALRAIAFDLPALPVDANVERVLSRLFAVNEPLPGARRELRRLADGLIPARRSGDVAQALMDLGSKVCTPRQPACRACPLRPNCAAAAAGLAHILPRKTPRAARPLRHGIAFLLIRKTDGAILLRRRPDNGLLGGMIELPSTPWRDERWSLDDGLGHAPHRADWRMEGPALRHVFSHFALDLELARGHCDAGPGGVWTSAEGLSNLALPSLTRKLLCQAGVMRP